MALHKGEILDMIPRQELKQETKTSITSVLWINCPWALVSSCRLMAGIKEHLVLRPRLSVGSRESCLGKVPASLKCCLHCHRLWPHLLPTGCGTALLWLCQARLIGHM